MQATLPNEICGRCKKEISARSRANVFDGKIVCCSRCYRELVAQRDRDEEARARPVEAWQIDRATELGITLSGATTKQEAADVLDRWSHFGRDDVAPPWLHDYALEVDVWGVTRLSGERQLIRRIFENFIGSGDAVNLARWFAFNVARDVFGDAEWPSILRSAQLQRAAEFLASDKSILRSIRRTRGCMLDVFGVRTRPSGSVLEGASRRTRAYVAARDALRREF